MNVLDLPDLKAGEYFGTFAYRVLDRTSTRLLRLMDVFWTGNASPDDDPGGGRLEVIERVGLLRRAPLITRVWRAKDGSIGMEIESRAEPLFLLDGDQVTVMVA